MEHLCDQCNVMKICGIYTKFVFNKSNHHYQKWILIGQSQSPSFNNHTLIISNPTAFQRLNENTQYCDDCVFQWLLKGAIYCSGIDQGRLCPHNNNNNNSVENLQEQYGAMK